MMKPLNLDRYIEIEKFYDKKLNLTFLWQTMAFGITLFCIGLAVGAMILDAKDEIVSLFILLELSFLSLQILFSLTNSYFLKKRTENYEKAERKVNEYIKLREQEEIKKLPKKNK